MSPLSPRCAIPDAQVAGPSRGCQKRPIGTERDVINAAHGTLQLQDCATHCRIPEPDRLVVAGGNQALPVWTIAENGSSHPASTLRRCHGRAANPSVDEPDAVIAHVRL